MIYMGQAMRDYLKIWDIVAYPLVSTPLWLFKVGQYLNCGLSHACHIASLITMIYGEDYEGFWNIEFWNITYSAFICQNDKLCV